MLLLITVIGLMKIHGTFKFVSVTVPLVLACDCPITGWSVTRTYVSELLKSLKGWVARRMSVGRDEDTEEIPNRENGAHMSDNCAI
jgi:hypothetical protein